MNYDEVDRNDALKFAERTRTNLTAIERLARDDPNDVEVHPVTQLINSLLGLVVFVREQKFSQEIEKLKLSALAKRGWPVWQSTVDTPWSLGRLVRHIRNAIAHGGIKFSSDAALLEEVDFEFTDRSDETGAITWQGKISGPDLRTFVLKLVAEVEDRIG